MSDKNSKVYTQITEIRNLLVLRPCRNEKGEGKCVIQEEPKSYIMIISVKILYVY